MKHVNSKHIEQCWCRAKSEAVPQVKVVAKWVMHM